MNQTWYIVFAPALAVNAVYGKRYNAAFENAHNLVVRNLV